MKGKVALITGASSGIGAGTAAHFASLGCLLSLTGRNQERLQETRKTCVQAGCKEEDILLISTDLEIIENLATIVDRTISKFGKLDILINNAGWSLVVQFQKTTSEEYDKLMNINQKQVFFLTQHALPYLLESKGCIVNLSTAAAKRPMKFFMSYGMAKAGLDHFTRTLAVEYAPKGLRVNSVNPACIDTPIWKRNKFFDHIPDYYGFVQDVHAMGRGGEVQEAVEAIAFLADSSKSSFITGVTLMVDGGSILMGPL